MRTSLVRSSLVSSSINLKAERGPVSDIEGWISSHVLQNWVVSYLSLLLDGDRIFGGLSSSGISSIAASKERREAWDCDPASEAIRSASLRANWASWKKHAPKQLRFGKIGHYHWVSPSVSITAADQPPAGAESLPQAPAACGQFPAVSLDTVSVALPHCDWSGSLLLCWRRKGHHSLITKSIR